MKLRDLFVEFKVNNEPRDEVHYRQLKKDLQKIQNDPKLRDPETKRAVIKRKAELDGWAHSKGIKSENSIEEEPVAVADLKRVGASVQKVYVHKDGKTILVPTEKKDEYLAKGYKLSPLKAEDQVDERMPASVIKHKEKLAHMSDEELAKHFQDKDDETLKQMAWRHGYGKMSDYYVNRKNKGMSQDTNEGEMRMDKSAFVQMLANKIQEPQKGHGRPEYDNRLLAKMYKLITGKDVDFEGNKFTITMNKPTTEDIDEKGRIALEKAGFDPSKVKEYLAVFNDHGDTSDVDQMNMDKIGLADAMSMVLASHDVKNETVQEDAPFDGMSLVRMALMKKFITAEEWHGLKDKWKNAVAELEQNYDDWPDGEGFGSSDHNFAIKELMELVGYEFDDKDTSGRFVVSKMPPELEKMGIKNARMKDAVTTDEDADVDAQFKSDVLQFLNTKLVQVEKQIELQPAETAEEKEDKEFALKLFDFVQAKLEQKDDANDTLVVPKSMTKK